MQRRRSYPHTFDENIAAEKARLTLQAAELPDGPEKKKLFQKIRQLEVATDMSEWLSSPALAPPK